MKYFRTNYQFGNGTAILAYTDDGEPYGDVTVNLDDYDMFPPDENHIFMPTYKMDEDFIEQIEKDLIEEIIRPVPIGYGIGLLVKLRDDWKDICTPFE